MTTYNIDQIVKVSVYKAKKRDAKYVPEKTNGIIGRIIWLTPVTPAHFIWGSFSWERMSVEEIKKEPECMVLDNVLYWRPKVCIFFSNKTENEFYFDTYMDALDFYSTIQDKIKNKIEL